MIIRQSALILLLSVVSSIASAFSTARIAASDVYFAPICASGCCYTGNFRLFMAPEEESELMRNEIENMRREAVRRIEVLNSQLPSEEDDNATTTAITSAVQVEPPPTETLRKSRDFVSGSMPSKVNGSLSTKPGPPTVKPRKTPAQKRLDEMSLLEGTNWKVMLNIGREEARSLLPENAPTSRSGTWMPKTWGISGERLLLSLELEFMPDKLTEEEEFLNGFAGSKIMHVVNQELTLGPSMKEGSKTVPVKDGGWRVCKGEGPLKTDILRFYFEVTEEVSHQGGDVYCPAGRVYCTCGYFPQFPDRRGVKEELRQKQESLRRRYDQLSREMEEDDSIVSWDKVVRTKELLQIRVQAGQLAERMNEARVRQPDKGLLRLSKKGDVGLTREGGVCSKNSKAFITEYNILGKFGIGSVTKRRTEELLP